MKKEQLVADLEALCAPIVKEKGYDLYHIEYVKENNEYENKDQKAIKINERDDLSTFKSFTCIILCFSFIN